MIMMIIPQGSTTTTTTTTACHCPCCYPNRQEVDPKKTTFIRMTATDLLLLETTTDSRNEHEHPRMMMPIQPYYKSQSSTTMETNNSNKKRTRTRTRARSRTRVMVTSTMMMMIMMIAVVFLTSTTVPTSRLLLFVSGRLAATPTHRRLSTSSDYSSRETSPSATSSGGQPTQTSNTRSVRKTSTSTSSTSASKEEEEEGDITTPIILSSRPDGFFHPLECNKDLDKVPCSMTSWQSTFGSKVVFEDTLTIPCGTCVVLTASQVASSASTLEFRRGLIVEGKLVLVGDERMAIQIVTKYIVVYGTLIMENTKQIVDGHPTISIEFIDDDGDKTAAVSNDVLLDRSFRPPYDRDDLVCGGGSTGGGRCDMGGRNAFIVAGGQIDIRGIPKPSMPTWVPLIDVRDSSSTTSTSQLINGKSNGDGDFDLNTEPNDEGYLGYVPPPMNCNEDGILISHDFLTSSPSQNTDAIDMYFRPSYGSKYEMTNRGTMKFVDRTHPQHCPIIDLQRIRHCLRLDQVYLLTVRLVLHNATTDLHQSFNINDNSNDDVDTRTECSRTGENCLSIYQAWTNARGMGHTASQWKESLHDGTRFGQITTIDIPFNFTKRVLNEENIFEIIQLRGPGPGVDMELVSFDLRAPPKEFYPRRDDICDGNLIRNGDGELNGLNAYPFTTNNPEVRVSIRTEDNRNRYFAITGRAASVAKAPDRRKGKKWKSAGIAYTVIPEMCIRKGYYSFQADVRMQPPDRAAEARWIIKGIFDDKKQIPVSETLATCPPSTGGWLNCNGGIEIAEKLQGFNQYEIVLEMDSNESDGVDYDVDNLSLQFEMSAGLDQLILPKSIQDGWGVGAEIIVASPQQQFDAPENDVRTITQIEELDQEGEQVRISLDTPLDQPFGIDSSNSDEMTAHVALLSRNIVLKANNGGHISVLNTPSIAQTLQGVELVGFGQENEVEPIRFDSCQGGTSVVSKNTIRQSNNGCILLNATSDILVESNVGFDIMASSCFVAERGSENNIFNNNIGVPVIRLPELDMNGEDTATVPPVFLTDSKSNTWSGNVAVRNIDGESVGNIPLVQINEHGLTSNPLGVFNMQEATELDEI